MRTTKEQTERVLRMRDEITAERKRNNRKLLAIIPSAACFCMVIAFSAVALSTGLLRGCESKACEGTNDCYSAISENEGKPSADKSDNAATTVRPTDVPTEYRYGNCELGGSTYSSVGAKINEKYISGYLGEGKTYFLQNNDRIYEVCEVYEIKNIKSDFAVAVKYKGDDGYYFRYSYPYSFESAADIYSALGIEYYIDEIFASRTEYGETKNEAVTYGVPAEMLKSIFSGECEAVKFSQNYTPGAITVSAENNSVYGNNKMNITLYSDGYIHIVFCGINMMFRTDTSDFFAKLPSCPVVSSEVTDSFGVSTETTK